MTDPRWMQLLRAEAARSNIGEVALLLGYSRTAISQVLAGTYLGKPDRIAQVVLTKLAAHDCPHLERQIVDADCRAMALTPVPTHHPMRLAHWRTCQQCPNRPKEDRG